jgi:hypothetical protein
MKIARWVFVVVMIFLFIVTILCVTFAFMLARNQYGEFTVGFQKPSDTAVSLVQPTANPPIPPTPAVPVAPADPATVTTAPEKSVEVAKPAEPISKNLFLSPVLAEDTFNTESAWLIAEPGVLLDNATAWTIPGTKDTWYSNVPEGAFAYYSLGQGKITVDGYSLDLPYKEGHNYLVLVRGRIDDAIVDTDRNLTAEITDFVPGHAIWSHMPKGAYVSKDWFLQQLVASTTESYTNCGALGCSHVTVVLFDVDTHLEQRFAVEASDLTKWTQIK